MSFGCSISDVISLTQIARTVVQNSRRACGEHDELTREVTSLHVVLKRLRHEVAKPESPINRSNDTCGEEVEVIAGGCRRVLKILDQILEKYNALSETERSGRKLWQKIKFGNGQMGNLADLRTKIIYYTTALSLFINMMTIGTMGSVEKQLNDAGGDLKDIKDAVNSITAHLMAKDRSEGSVLTAYPDDDKAFWKELRRELIEDGFSSSVIGEHKSLIKTYIRELGARGLLDDAEPQTMNGTLANDIFALEDTPNFTAPGNADTADPHCSNTPAAEKKSPCRLTGPVTIPVSLPTLELQLNTDFISVPDSRPGMESQSRLAHEGIVDVQDLIPLSNSQDSLVPRADTNRPLRSHCRGILPVEHSNAKYLIASSYAGAPTYHSESCTRPLKDGSAPNLDCASVGTKASTKAINPISKKNDFLNETNHPESPAELLRIVSDAWYDEFVSASQFPNIAPTIDAKNTLRNLLPKLNAVDLEAVGWNNELEAYRTSLIKQIRIRLNTLELRSQTLRKHHICRPRCFCMSDTSDKVNTIKSYTHLLETPPDPATEPHDVTPPLKSSSPGLNLVRRREVSAALHQIWHNQHETVAPLCLEWAKQWGRRVWEQGRTQKLFPMNTEFMKLVSCMRENMNQLERLDLDGDEALTACREGLRGDVKSMMSSLRMFKTDRRWMWKNYGMVTKGTRRRVCVDVSWTKGIIVVSLGPMCGVCSGDVSFSATC